MVFGKFGIFRFETSPKVIRTFNQLNYNRENRIQVHEILGGTYALELLGESLPEVQLDSIVSIERGLNAEKEIKKVEQMFDSKEAYSLIIGKTFFGKYIIKKCSFETVRIDNTGSVLSAKISLGLLRVL